MKILFLSPILPHAPIDGDKLRAFHWIRLLAKRHQVTLASFYAQEDERRGLKALEKMTQGMHLVRHSRPAQYLRAGLGFFSPGPLNVSAFRSPAMDRLVQGLCQEQDFDLVFSYRLRMAPYALKCPARLKVIDFTDCLTGYFQRRADKAGNPMKKWLWGLEAASLGRAEAAAARKFDLCLVNSSADARELESLAQRPRGAILTLSNGVDFHYYHPSSKGRKEKDSLVFVGNLAYAPNAEAVLWFGREVFPLIRSERPMAQFHVVGGHAPKTLEKLKLQDGVCFEGFVADTRPFAWNSAVSVCPLRQGAGRQNKVLEAMALGVPVVATSLAVEGIEARPGRQLLGADSPRDFARACLRLMGDRALAAGISARAKAWVKKNYQWEASGNRLGKALRGLAVLALVAGAFSAGCMKRPQVREDLNPKVSDARAPMGKGGAAPQAEGDENKSVGDRMFQRGDYGKAVVYLREDVKKNPKDAKLWRHLGSAYGNADNYDNAIYCYRKALDYNPADPKTYYNISLMLDYTGGFKEAEKMARQGLKMEPKNAEMHSSLGNILADKDDEDGALKQYEQALQLKPDDPITRFNKGSLHFKRHEFSQAEDEYRKVLKISPRDVEAAQNLGAIFILQGKMEDAEKLNRWVIEQAPRDEDTLENAYFNLGIIYDKQARQREALDMYKLALQVSPWDAAAYVNAAFILEKLGKTAEALAYWEKFSRLFPASKRQAEVQKRVEALKKILGAENPGKKADLPKETKE